MLVRQISLSCAWETASSKVAVGQHRPCVTAVYHSSARQLDSRAPKARVGRYTANWNGASRRCPGATLICGKGCSRQLSRRLGTLRNGRFATKCVIKDASTRKGSGHPVKSTGPQDRCYACGEHDRYSESYFREIPGWSALQEIASFFVRLSHTGILVLIRRKAAHAMRSPGL